ncbi:cnnm4 [Symbiodinium necroappetens]|uniref:Cnnm4 protein n=1 Tax=Symbiodinium necroappetens TaxID=1628268 RepID=A0A812WHM9_9DINO|nr:cnnm4 [Symbiodinium necroappetens]
MSSQWQSPWNAAERKAARKMLMSMLRTASISGAATALAIPLSCLVYMLSSSWVLSLQRLHSASHNLPRRARSKDFSAPRK